MTRAVQQIRSEPGGEPVVGVETQVRRLGDSRQVGDTLTSDSNGVVTFTENGSLGPITLGIYGQPGGDRSLASGEAMTSGVFSPAELPAAFSVLGDGVIRGYLGELAVSIAGDTLTVSTGGAVVAGYPVIFYAPATILLSRPTASTRVDRIVVYIAPLTGIAIIGVLLGDEGSGIAQALTQTTERTEIGLGQVTVGTVQPIDPPTDERVFAGDRIDVVGSQHNGNASTTSSTGEAITHLPITLTLPRAVTYDIEAEISGQQISVAGTTAWVLQSTYGPTFNGLALSNPGQVAVDSTGLVFVADTGNNRLLLISSAGSFVGSIARTGITGVCVDSSDNVYVCLPSTVVKYTSSLVLQWSQPSDGILVHCATDGTNLYVTDRGFGRARKFLCSTGAYVTSWTVGANPTGIAVGGGEVYVVGQLFSPTEGLNVFTTAGVIQRTITIPAGSRGVALEGGGHVVVAAFADDLLIRYTTAGTATDALSMTAPSGVGISLTDTAWVSNATAGTVSTIGDSVIPGGYGQIALEIDGTVSAYTGVGNRTGAISNTATGTKEGPGSVVIRGYAKATANTFTMSGLVLSARATPRG